MKKSQNVTYCPSRVGKSGESYGGTATHEAMPVLEPTGYCSICMGETRFVAAQNWSRDHYVCERCNSIPRQRALVEVLNILRPNWRSLSIHETSPATGFFAEQCSDYSCSIFHQDMAVGSNKNGNSCEDPKR